MIWTIRSEAQAATQTTTTTPAATTTTAIATATATMLDPTNTIDTNKLIRIYLILTILTIAMKFDLSRFIFSTFFLKYFHNLLLIINCMLVIVQIFYLRNILAYE